MTALRLILSATGAGLSVSGATVATGYAELPEGTQLDLPRLAKPYHQEQLRDQLDLLLA